MLPLYYEYHNPVKILSGEAALENIPYELHALEAHAPLLLSDQGLKQVGAVDTVLHAIAPTVPKAIFTDIPADSSVAVVNQIAAYYKEQGCDSILAVGGGSVIDTAKGVRMVISQNTDNIESLMGCEVLTAGRHIPFLAVPMTLPPKVTASTGIDALCHAIESFTCLQKNPMSDAYAAGAIPLIMRYLPIAAAHPGNKEARMAMANASLMAGTSFGNSMVGLVHAIGHALGGVCHVAHGDAMSILLPHVMAYNLDKCRSGYSDLLLHLAGPEVYCSTPADHRAEKAVEVVTEFVASFAPYGLPMTLKDTGRVNPDQFRQVAETAISDGAIIVNPKAAGIPEILTILKEAF